MAIKNLLFFLKLKYCDIYSCKKLHTFYQTGQTII